MFDKQLKKKIQSFLDVTNGINSKELKNIIEELHFRHNELSEVEINNFNQCMKKIIKKNTKNKNNLSN